MIGRMVSRNEVIHHINEIKTDNTPENLYLFPSNSSHVTYHMGIITGAISPITRSNLADHAVTKIQNDGVKEN